MPATPPLRHLFLADCWTYVLHLTSTGCSADLVLRPQIVLVQNPDDEECPIIKEYVRLATTDSSATVREAAVLAICVSEVTLPTILQRTRDSSKAVAVAAASKVQATIPQSDQEGALGGHSPEVGAEDGDESQEEEEGASEDEE